MLHQDVIFSSTRDICTFMIDINVSRDAIAIDLSIGSYSSDICCNLIMFIRSAPCPPANHFAFCLKLESSDS